MILDSNIVIHAAKPAFPGLRRMIAGMSPAVSAVTVVEVLGYHKLTAAAQVLPATDAVIARAVALRQVRKMALGDALIAATAVVAGRPLLTQNLKHFAWVPGLTASDPLAAGDPP